MNNARRYRLQIATIILACAPILEETGFAKRKHIRLQTFAIDTTIHDSLRLRIEDTNEVV